MPTRFHWLNLRQSVARKSIEPRTSKTSATINQQLQLALSHRSSCSLLSLFWVSSILLVVLPYPSSDYQDCQWATIFWLILAHSRCSKVWHPSALLCVLWDWLALVLPSRRELLSTVKSRFKTWSIALPPAIKDSVTAKLSYPFTRHSGDTWKTPNSSIVKTMRKMRTGEKIRPSDYNQ